MLPFATMNPGYYRSKASLVPETATWDDVTALTYLLERGPYSVDPNRGKEYVHGWYDDNRPYSDQTFEQALRAASMRDGPSTEEDRIREARKYLNYPDKGLPYLMSIYKAGHYSGAGPQSLLNEIAKLLAKDSLHPEHRFRMIPHSRASTWTIPGLSPTGTDILAWLPTLLRMGDVYDTRLPLDQAVDKAKSLHYAHARTNR